MTKFEDSQRTLSNILAQLINNNALQVDRFAPPPVQLQKPTNLSVPVRRPLASLNSQLPISTGCQSGMSFSQPVTPVQPAINPVMQPAINPVQQAINPVQPAINPVSEQMQPAINPVQPAINPVSEQMQPAINPVQPAINPVQQAINPVQPAINPVQPTINPVSEQMQPAINPVQHAINPVQQAINPVQPAINPVSEQMQPAINPVSQLFESPVSEVDLLGYINDEVEYYDMDSSGKHQELSDELIRFENVVTPSGTLMTPERLLLIKKKSCSRRNFSALINVEIFDEATRKASNVKGKKPKKKLNPVLMQYIKSLAFQYYPLAEDEDFNDQWRKCEISIDEINRRKL